MAFKEVSSLDCDTTITLGGKDKKTGKPNPTRIEGYFLGTKEVGPNKFNKQKTDVVHVFQTKEGNTGVWGKTDLDTKLKNAIPGRMVRATFTGTIPTNKGNDMLKYKVEVDDSNTIDVSDLVVSTSDDNSYANETVDEESEDDAEDEYETPPKVAAAALASQAERKAKIDALLNKGKNK